MMRSSREQAIALLAGAPYVHLASSGPDGQPVLRALHGVVCDGALYFHGSPAGEKVSLVGREAVVAHEELVAEIPSYWTDATMACPATSLFVSVQAHAVVERVEDPVEKASALQALMRRFQPEGGHAEIRYDDPRYRKPVDGVALWKLALDRVDGKWKLAQNRGPDYVRTVIDRLWERGRATDARAIELLLEANTSVERPAFLQGPERSTLHPWSDPSTLTDALALVRDEYWNAARFDDEAITAAHRASSAWVLARDEHGAVIATARAVSDGVKYCYLGDVAVRSDWRGRGVGAALVRMLLDHPAVRRAARVELATRDAMAFYERLGFSLVSQQHNGSFVRSTMALVRAQNVVAA
jgi:GNAT superfamily N-acetyltransferase/nitroimidazol reductase NimA-like FMN-containing flavoprotein (pyridoxamine 5'-phosphate oxidase superfamily)